MWFVFRRSRKTNHLPPSRERSEREMQKTLLGYAHPSNNIYINIFLPFQVITVLHYHIKP
ncbi:MAG: hypothetical protein U5L45_03685 [Saprospiraceae bacterium]|nr:hypothetical protein [Saprospiraceae bacterium]